MSVKDGKLSFESMTNSYGFLNEIEQKNYKRDFPFTYAVMGGHKYEPDSTKWNYTPLTEEGKKIVEEAQKRDKYIHNIHNAKLFVNRNDSVYVPFFDQKNVYPAHKLLA